MLTLIFSNILPIFCFLIASLLSFRLYTEYRNKAIKVSAFTLERSTNPKLFYYLLAFNALVTLFLLALAVKTFEV